jgi:diaminopimelate decarboxylase
MTRSSQSRIDQLVGDELRALKRAGKNALELARQTGTPCYVMEGNKIVDIAKRGRKKTTAKKKRRSA